MEWYARLRRKAIASAERDFDLLYDVGLTPAVPPEYEVPGLVAITFRLHPRPEGGHVYVTALDVDAALRLGARLGLDEAEGLAFVDSHERVHIALQLADVPWEVEEEHSRFVDAVWLSLRHPRAAELVASGEFGLVEHVERDFWERLVDAAQQ